MSERDDDPGTAGTSKPGLADQAQQAARQASSDAAEVAQEAKAGGASLSDEVSGRVSSAAHAGKDDVAGRIEDFAKAVHRSGEQLEGHQDFVAKLVERGADELGALAGTLRSNDLRGLGSKLQTLARQQPALFVGAAMAAGFAAVRFGKVTAAGASQDDLPSLPETRRG